MKDLIYKTGTVAGVASEDVFATYSPDAIRRHYDGDPGERTNEQLRALIERAADRSDDPNHPAAIAERIETERSAERAKLAGVVRDFTADECIEMADRVRAENGVEDAPEIVAIFNRQVHADHRADATRRAQVAAELHGTRRHTARPRPNRLRAIRQRGRSRAASCGKAGSSKEPARSSDDDPANRASRNPRPSLNLRAWTALQSFSPASGLLAIRVIGRRCAVGFRRSAVTSVEATV